MDHYKEMADFAAAFDMKMAVVQVKPGNPIKRPGVGTCGTIRMTPGP